MNIYDILKKLKIDYKEVEHKAVYTIEEALNENIPSIIEGIECKNLFVKNKNRYYLIFLECNKKANLKEIAKIVNESKLSFASEEELKQVLGVGIGAVTPLGILNDSENRVVLILDKQLKEEKVLVHPNINTKTVSLKFEDLVKIIEASNHKYIYI